MHFNTSIFIVCFSDFKFSSDPPPRPIKFRQRISRVRRGVQERGHQRHFARPEPGAVIRYRNSRTMIDSGNFRYSSALIHTGHRTGLKYSTT